MMTKSSSRAAALQRQGLACMQNQHGTDISLMRAEGIGRACSGTNSQDIKETQIGAHLIFPLSSWRLDASTAHVVPDPK